MAQPLQSVAVNAPGFFGLNTQDSPTALNEQFALVADNCVIDQFGRIGARKGWTYVTTTNGDALVSISEYIAEDGTTEIISASDSAVYQGTTTLTDITPAGYTVSDGNFDTANLNNLIYLFREGEDPLYYDGTTCDLVENHANYSGTIPKADIVESAYGRLWVAKTDTNNHTVYWSDLLIGQAWDTGSSGSIDISKVWPAGSDEITGLAVHNNFLIIFGRSQILVYSGANDPATMQLSDSVVGIGCIARDSIQVVGTDVIFLSEDGVRSFGRTIQEKSAPLRDLSKNIRSELSAAVLGETGRIYSVYSPEEAFYLLHLEDNATTYCFDMRSPLQDGSHRATRWNNINPLSLCHTRNGLLLMGQELGVAEYDTFKDNNNNYIMTYLTNYLDFGAPSNLKFLKNLKATIIGGSNTQTTLQWGYDYSYSFKKKTFLLSEQIISEYSVDEYGIANYNAGVLINRPTVQASGGGVVVQLGLETTVNGSQVSIQRLTAQAIIGRTI